METAFYDWHREACIAVRLGLWRFGSQEMLAEGTRAVFGPRAVGERDRGEIAGALDVASKASDRRSQAPAERFIEEMFPVNIEHRLSIDCEERLSGSLIGRLRRRSKINRWLPFGRDLRFFVTDCSVPPPYDLYWKVRNVGPAAQRRKMERGEILLDAGLRRRDETTNFSGEHYVEAYVVKNRVCVARDRILVPIDSR